jgi:hypothetical protein
MVQVAIITRLILPPYSKRTISNFVTQNRGRRDKL